ncbi:NAAT family transporter [Acuticoccus sp. MNP-M23]|uniref:MarC family protein n=1 Tax=Acuticoccus sp. MNP-M23 TaxID=3072793 RepID=UPI002814D00F|nr:MarC family protein [Acuticoccus sp. MNP-M23]WMS42862.1 NAAT family transporter [Acuticoccus sp. MNP-M23]
MDYELFLKFFAALFAIMSPVANLPVFLSLTAGRPVAEQRKIAATTIFGLVIGSVVVGLGGNALLNLFGLGVNDFRLAGGFLILLIALNMVSGEKSQAHHGSASERQNTPRNNPAIYPLTVPILLGPGTISTMIIFRAQAHGVAGDIAYVAAVAGAIGLLAIAFFAAPFLSRVLGQTAVAIMSRLMGMILAAIAMEMMVGSLKALLPGLAG